MSLVVPSIMGAAGLAAGLFFRLRLGRPEKGVFGLGKPSEPQPGTPSFMIRQSWDAPSARPEEIVSWIVKHMPCEGAFTMELYHGIEEAHLQRHYLDEILLAGLFIVTLFLSIRAAIGR